MPDITPYNEKELLLRIAEGNEQAFRELYNIYERLLRPYLAELTASDADAGDLIQETMLRVWLNREQISTVDYPRAYIYRIASNLAYTWLRSHVTRKKVEHNLEPAADEPHPSENIFLVKSIRNIVSQAIKDMPPQRSRIYLMHREKGMKAAEISKVLGISVSTVNNTLREAVKYIREQVEKAGYFLPFWLLLFFL